MNNLQDRFKQLLLGFAILGAGANCGHKAGTSLAGQDSGPGQDASAGPEAGPESGREAGTDNAPAASPETGADAPSDIAPDVGKDAAADAASDSAPDAGKDTAADAASDSAPDAGKDTGADGDSASAPDVGKDTAADAASDAFRPADAGPGFTSGLPQPMCVWNEAYQENYAADTVSEILAGARNCYVLIDPFANTDARAAVSQMKQAGNTVSCYISVGTCEDWRDDFAAIKPYCVSTQWGDWPGEYFVNRTDPALLALMKARIDKMTAWGCNMVEFDNMDWTFDPAYRTTYGIAATASDGEAYNEALCAYVHGNGMGCMAKSSAQGASDFDGLTVESSPGNTDWWNAADLTGMLSSRKIGIVVHYNETDCASVRATYQAKYGSKLSFICEDRALKKYRHFP